MSGGAGIFNSRWWHFHSCFAIGSLLIPRPWVWSSQHKNERHFQVSYSKLQAFFGRVGVDWSRPSLRSTRRGGKSCAFTVVVAFFCAHWRRNTGLYFSPVLICCTPRPWECSSGQTLLVFFRERQIDLLKWGTDPSHGNGASSSSWSSSWSSSSWDSSKSVSSWHEELNISPGKWLRKIFVRTTRPSFYAFSSPTTTSNNNLIMCTREIASLTGSSSHEELNWPGWLFDASIQLQPLPCAASAFKIGFGRSYRRTLYLCLVQRHTSYSEEPRFPRRDSQDSPPWAFSEKNNRGRRVYATATVEERQLCAHAPQSTIPMLLPRPMPLPLVRCVNVATRSKISWPRCTMKYIPEKGLKFRIKMD